MGSASSKEAYSSQGIRPQTSRKMHSLQFGYRLQKSIIVKSARNIPGVLTTVANMLNVYDIINAQYLVVDQAALATIEEVYA